MITLVNKHKHTPTEWDVPIYRTTPLGNDWDWRGSLLAKHQCASRDEAIANYKTWLLDMIVRKDINVCTELNRIVKLYRKYGKLNLVCFCVPDDCHGRIIKEILEAKLSPNGKLTKSR